MKRIPNWLWPKDRKANATAIVRSGRVLHWAFAILALLVSGGMLIGGSVTLVDILFNPIGGYGSYTYTRDPSTPVVVILSGLALGMFFLMIGRAARYVFSNE
jgi:hypothetical protein